jgi:hypothetical protein
MGRYEQAIQALIEAMPDTDPFAGPVRHLSAKLELSNAEAHALTMELVEKNLIRTARQLDCKRAPLVFLQKRLGQLRPR